MREYVDKHAIYNKMLERGISGFPDLSSRIGRSRSYLQVTLSKGWLPSEAYGKLCEVLGVTDDSLKMVPMTKHPERREPEIVYERPQTLLEWFTGKAEEMGVTEHQLHSIIGIVIEE